MTDAPTPAWWSEPVSWCGKPRYEPAPPAPTLLTLIEECRVEHDGTYVYLAQAGDAYKIGISKNVPERLGELNCASRARVELVALRRGSQNLERRLHARLKHHRLNGEWFHASPEVYDVFFMEPEHADTQAVA